MSATRWTGLYDESWHDLIVPEAFSHPAKMARGLIHRIYRHLIAQGHVRAGDHVLDPFGGVACGALDAMTYGLSWTGCELEDRFVTLGNANLALWRQRFGFTTGQLLQGDSRQLGTVLAGQAQGMVTSPPFQQSLESTDVHFQKAARPGRTNQEAIYGTTTGQLGAMPAGALVTSPPYAEGLSKEHTYSDHGKRDRESHRRIMTEKGIVDPHYGTTPGNLGNLPAGALITSPPFEASEGSMTASFSSWHDRQIALGNMHGHARGQHATAQEGYGKTPEQVGTLQGDTFWSAATAILTACWPLLQPGAICAFVLKDYVRKGKRVPFCAQWRACCEAVGYTFAEEIHAMLVEDHGTQTTIFGEDETVSTSRKSFFRRLAEKKGSPRIDYETVLLMRRP